MHRIRNVKWQSNNRSSEQPQYHSCTYVNDYSSDCLVSLLTSECLTVPGEPTDQWMSHCAWWANWPVNVSPCLVSLLTSECLTVPGEPTDQWMSHLAWWAYWPVNVSPCLVSQLTSECLAVPGEPTDHDRIQRYYYTSVHSLPTLPKYQWIVATVVHYVN